MSKTPISQSVFGTKYFKRFDSYAFTRENVVVPLVLRELVRASLAMPFGFIKTQEDFLPVAILGLENKQNYFVDSEGRWLGRYVPAAFRGHPFSLANDPENKKILCFDVESGLLTDEGGEPFFDVSGKPSDAIKDILNFLTQVELNQQATRQMCGLLARHGLFEPWQIKMDAGSDNPAFSIEGVLKINEGAFNRLGEKEVYALHQGGALAVIYCQLLSVQHLSTLGKLAQARAAVKRDASLPKTDAGDLDLSFLADDTTLSFEDLS